MMTGGPEAQIVVRRATVADADAIGSIHVRAWQAGYRGTMPDDFLDGLNIPDRQSQWRRGLSEPVGDRVTTVVEDPADGRVCGFCTVGDLRGDPHPLGAEVGELWAINLEPEAWGRGIATALLRGGERALADRGHAVAVLWVLEANARGRRFYEREGWVTDDAVKVSQFGGVDLREVRYRRALTRTRPARD
jgi:GNAT superfamily N-acetyltransferase